MIQKVQSRFDFQFSWRSILLVFFVVLLAISTAVSLYNVTRDQHSSKWGGIDLHSYWFSALFVRQGINPYAALDMGIEPALPISYIDGHVTREEPIGQDNLTKFPVQLWTTLLVTPLAWLSWPNAKDAFALFNLVAAIIVPLLFFRILPQDAKLKPVHMVVIVLAFAAMGGVKYTIFRGQSSLLLFGLLIIAILLMEDHPILSGIALGLSLSKLTLVFPFLLFFLWRRKFIPLIVAAVVYFLAFVIYAQLAGYGVVETMQQYLSILTSVAGQEGIHLLGQIGRDSLAVTRLAELFGNRALRFIPLAAGILLMLVILSRHPKLIRGEYSDYGPRLTIVELELLTIFSLINLLTAYHRIYDAVLILLLFPLLIVWWRRVDDSPGMTIPKAIYLLLVAFMLILLLVPRRLETFMIEFLGMQGFSLHIWEPLGLTYGLVLALVLSLIMHFIPSGQSEKQELQAI